MSKPDIPPDQLQRIQSIVEPLLADLRRRTQELLVDAELALTFELDSEAGQ